MNNWINVNEKLPEFSGDTWYSVSVSVSETVLVYDGNKQRVAYLTFDKDDNTCSWISDCSEGWVLCGVTHWKYLSENPK